jgi:hypothetical protein
MNYNSIKNFFSPIKLNPNRSEFNVFTSSERKRNSNENNIDLFHTNTIKRGKDSENYDSIKKIKNVNQRIDDVISFLNQKQEHIENFQNKTFSSNEKFNWNKYIMDSKKKTEYEKIKENEILKERNAYLKKKLKQIKLKNEISNNDTNSSENSNYYFLLNKNKQLINENKNLKEEYNILKLDQKSNTNINKIMDNKIEVISKMKSLKYSINNLLNLLATTNATEPNKNHNNNYNMINYNNNSLKTHTINKYDITYRINDFEPDNNYPMNNSTTKDDNKKDNNIIFTEGGNLNINNNNSLLNENDTDENNNYNEDSSDDEQFEISLKQFEKIDNKNLNNLIFKFNNGYIKKNNTANVTKRQKLNKKMSNLTEKRKNINNANSYTKEMINKKEMKKDFKKYFNDEKIMKNNGDNMSYNFLNFRNICLDKKMLFGNGKNISDLNNNIAQNFKINNTNIKSNKIKYDILRTKNISQKTYKGNSHSKNFRKVNKSSKKIFK